MFGSAASLDFRVCVFPAGLWSVVTLGMASKGGADKTEQSPQDTLIANQSLLLTLVLANHCTSDVGLPNPYREALFSFTNSQGKLQVKAN